MRNDALLAGAVDFVGAGVTPLVTLWAKTQGSMDVKGIGAMESAPIFLNTRNPAIRSLKDFTDNDKIALPGVKVSLQAVVLQIAAAKEFGIKSFDRLDRLTVSLSPPDGMAALAGGRSEINSTFTIVPYQFLEPELPGVHNVLNSQHKVLGGTAQSIATSARRPCATAAKEITVDKIWIAIRFSELGEVPEFLYQRKTRVVGRLFFPCSRRVLWWPRLTNRYSISRVIGPDQPVFFGQVRPAIRMSCRRLCLRRCQMTFDKFVADQGKVHRREDHGILELCDPGFEHKRGGRGARRSPRTSRAGAIPPDGVRGRHCRRPDQTLARSRSTPVLLCFVGALSKQRRRASKGYPRSCSAFCDTSITSRAI